MSEPEKESRSFRERMEEANELVRKGRQERGDEALIEEIHQLPTVSELLHELQNPDIENVLRRQMHLPEKVDSADHDDGIVTLEDEFRVRMNLPRRRRGL
jgi:Ser-tRNA(Ala) deacylase AlaX